MCRSVAKKPIGGAAKDTGLFECSDLTVVNGAQTVGAIAEAAEKDSDKTERARVSIRLISLENCPPEFERDVTRYTNTQNRIESRDFVALDPEQERIRGELAVDGIEYVYKSGDSPTSRETGFDLTEATVALACLQTDVAFAVMAKGSIGKLWDDFKAPPYTRIFNSSVPGPALWNAVQAVRVVEQELGRKRKTLEGRERLLAVHGNRFCIHAVFFRMGAETIQKGSSPDSNGVETIQKLTEDTFDTIFELVENMYPDNYLGSLFKNTGKCHALMEKFRREQGAA